MVNGGESHGLSVVFVPIFGQNELENCNRSRFLSLNLDLPLDDSDAICHLFGTLSTYLHFAISAFFQVSSSCSFSTRTSMSSATRRFILVLPHMVNFLLYFASIRYYPFMEHIEEDGWEKASLLNFSVVLNNGLLLPFVRTASLALSSMNSM